LFIILILFVYRCHADEIHARAAAIFLLMPPKISSLRWLVIFSRCRRHYSMPRDDDAAAMRCRARVMLRERCLRRFTMMLSPPVIIIMSR